MNCGFTLEHYKEIIELARDKGYTITQVKGYDDELVNSKTIVMRHDIDFSLEMAYELANFEYDLGVTSSYYILLHSETYNALSPKSMGMIEAISKMGNEIGLHYDSRYSLSHESDLISSIIRKGIYSYSQNCPTLTKRETHQGLFDVWDIDAKYISDSGRHWREGCLCTHIGKEKKLHVSMHPEWWVTNSKSREDTLHQLWISLQDKSVRDCAGIKQMLYDYYRDDLKMGGEKIVPKV